MEDFLIFLEKHSTGVLLLILILFAVVLTVRWLFQVFAIGKYRTFHTYTNEKGEKKVVKAKDKNTSTSITYILTQSLINIVDDFRHFLALLIVILFVILISISMWASKDNFDNMMEAMQLVIASLGGLLGSIIGYYYGESAARNKSEGITTDAGEVSNADDSIVEPEVGGGDNGDGDGGDGGDIGGGEEDDIIEPVGE
ncbi:MAG: hypothetical protein KTR22_01515 [Flavobacteriaceae bacterium]|nr:hypothetical protein [Flavobacteriaceae bacterium]